MTASDIKDIASDSIRLITEFGSSEMTESLSRIKEVASSVQKNHGIIQTSSDRI